jgi:DNA polymerase III delta prime subunit
MDAVRMSILKQFYNALPLQVSLPADPFSKDLPYIEGLHTSAGTDPVEELKTAILFNDSAISYLFTGQRGSGKTTELIRLATSLDREHECVSFYVDMIEYFNETSPIGVEELILGMLCELSKALELRYGQDPMHEGYWSRFVQYISKTDVEISELGVHALGAGELKVALKSDESFRRRMRKFLEQNTTTFLKNAREFVDIVVAKVRKEKGKNDTKVVLIVDSLEKIRGSGSDAQEIYQSIERTFNGSASSLRFNTMHVVYSVPPTLPLIAPGVGSLYSGGLCGLPQVKVEHRPDSKRKDRKKNESGITLMVSTVIARFPDWNQVFSKKQLERLAHASGGNLRIFFSLLRRVLLKAPAVSLPLSDDNLLTQAENDFRSEIELSDEARSWLIKVRDSHSSGLDRLDNLAILGFLCDSHLILDYRNGVRWYDVLPLVRDNL